jgi:SHS2 domain-containing protein
MPFTELPHTSDLYLEISGTNLENLFEEAAKAMFAKLGKQDPGTEGAVITHIEQEAPDKEGLLVKWLEALLIEHEVSRIIFTKFKVEIEGKTLRGTAFGGPGKTQENIKGVTFFDLKIWEENGTYKARILFDI